QQDLVDLVRPLKIQQVASLLEQGKLRIWEGCGEVPAVLRTDQLVLGSAEHQDRDGHRGQLLGHVGAARHPALGRRDRRRVLLEQQLGDPFDQVRTVTAGGGGGGGGGAP